MKIKIVIESDNEPTDRMLLRALAKALSDQAGNIQSAKSLKGRMTSTLDIDLDEDRPIEELAITKRVATALRRNNITTVQQLRMMTEDEILNIPNVGEKAFEGIRESIACIDEQARAWAKQSKRSK